MAKTAAQAIRQRGRQAPGRPPAISPEIIDKMDKLLRTGTTRTSAAIEAGISTTTFYEWMARGENQPTGIYADFRRMVEASENKAKISLVIEARRKNPCWVLARRHPDEWGAKVEVTGRIEHAHAHIHAIKQMDEFEESDLADMALSDGENPPGDG